MGNSILTLDAFLTDTMGTFYPYAREHYAYSLPQAARTFLSVDQLKRETTASGSKFFTRDAMRFFSSRIAPGMIAGRFFVTSEKWGHDAPRHWRVRWTYTSPGTDQVQISELETHFDSLDKARRAAHTLAALIDQEN